MYMLILGSLDKYSPGLKMGQPGWRKWAIRCHPGGENTITFKSIARNVLSNMFS